MFGGGSIGSPSPLKNQFPLLQDLDDLLILHLHRLPALFTQVFLHGFRPAILLGASTESGAFRRKLSRAVAPKNGWWLFQGKYPKTDDEVTLQFRIDMLFHLGFFASVCNQLESGSAVTSQATLELVVVESGKHLERCSERLRKQNRVLNKQIKHE